MPYNTGTGSALAGVNQMGNPYPSTITLVKVYADNSTSVSPTFYELNSPGQTYIAYNASTLTRSSARASRYIVSGQGFLAVATGTSSTFNFLEDQKVAYPNMTTTTTGTAQGDNLQKDSLDIARKGAYGFTITNADTTTYGANRFVLAIRLKPLPLYKLLAFLGQKVTKGVQLNWQVANAGNYTGFNLQKLNNTGSYDSLYSIQSDSTANYTFIDQHPVIGNNTYRLAQNDILGNITYSLPVTIGYNTSSPEGALTLYPNPASTQINVNIASATTNTTGYTADIYSSSGKLMKRKTVNGFSWTDDVSSYSKGVYIMSVKDTNGNIIGLAKFSKID
ncbi:unnamed protein product [Sphagnum tenellum]